MKNDYQIETNVPLPNKQRATGAAAHLHTMKWMKENPSMTKDAVRQRVARAAKRQVTT